MTYSAARTFAAHFYVSGEVDWEDTSHMGPAPEDRFSCVQLFMAWDTGNSPVRTNVLHQVASALIRAKTEWFSLRGNKWVIDPEKLRITFGLNDIGWLSGSPLVVDPDFTPGDSHGQKRSLVTLSLDPHLFQQPTTQSELGRPKHQKFEILDAPNLLSADLAIAPGVLGRALVYFDLDDFKAVNSKFTERIVDRELLPPIQRLVEAAAKGIGYAYAEGGDEMIVLLQNSTLTMAAAFADALRRLICGTTFKVNGEIINLSASFGVAATGNTPQTSPHAVGDAANAAKNYAKKNGKNCVAVSASGNFVIWEDGLVEPEMTSAP